MSAAGVFWLELDPASGDSALVTLHDGQPRRLTASGYSLRSRVNGYGGGALCLLGRWGYGVNAGSGQIDCIDLGSGRARPLTRTPGFRYGGLVADTANQRLLAVRERVASPDPHAHSPGGIPSHSEVQSLVAVELSGKVTVLHQGEDFYGAAAFSVDGRQLAWVCWQWPQMPWQTSTLWLADVEPEGALVQPRPLSTPEPAAVQQPRFCGQQLVALSDHGGWWRPYALDASPESTRWRPLPAVDADHANAPWQLGESHYQPLPGGGWVGVRYRDGFGELWWYPGEDLAPRRLAPDRTDFRSLCHAEGTLYCLASRWDALTEVLAIELATGRASILAGGEQLWPASRLSRPEPFTLTHTDTADAVPAAGFYYPPAGGGGADAPPLLVLIHGGPTSSSYPVLRPDIQFWCQQGFAVADLNYRGSTGLGRAFRLNLEGRWGQVDVDDACALVGQLTREGRADPRRAFIQGRSSGGYTALMAMTRSSVFRGATSLFGVTDPWHLRSCTHRFESGYLDWLLGPASGADDWRDRTPALLADQMTGPVLFFQGGQDTVVVPAQTEAMATAMAAAGLHAEVHLFPDEGHGFRHQANQVRVLEETLAFYQRLCRQVGEGEGNMR
ncbi:S9 family peptidase [Marinobacter mobilis]|uniref:Dipeptidyl aminopeptidase/acylaminoacyl peptidase n=1 Tax=Marinobacter mobilis TaxID=488533 RepID=A0A1H3ATB2_9GAMM|nr:prolyl oligopeptidase family serine peptidase [Marinobacter mobilis]SDX32980.1 Dipeptidyl aminopeptidase/acylaminoacyl peptidase [Marinobacter mobilis]